MAGRRGCVTSLWSGSERARFGERLRASLAGLVELDLLRSRQQERVQAALEPEGAAASRTQQTPGCEDSADCRWSAVSWDALALPDPEAVSADPPGAARPTCDSRPSSGFYSVSGSSLSASCGSVCSEGPGGPWARRPHSADHSAAQWPGARLQPAPLQQTRPERGERRPVSTGDLEILRGFLSLSDLCPGLGGRSPGSPSTSSHRPPASFCWDPRFPLDPKFCSDLVSRKTKEVYPYPSPLHAVALQSPLYAPCGASNPEPDDGGGGEEVPRCPCGPSPPDPPGPARADRYIGQLLRRYRRRPGSVLLSALDPGPAGRWQAKSLSLSSVCSGSTSSTLTGGALPSVPSLGSLGSSGSTPQAAWGGRRWVPSPAEDDEGRSDRGGSLRGLGGDGLYRGKHYSRVLVRAATLGTAGEGGARRGAQAGGSSSEGGAPKRGVSFRKRLELLFGGRGGREAAGSNRARGLFRSSSQGVLERPHPSREPPGPPGPPGPQGLRWASALEIRQRGAGLGSHGLCRGQEEESGGREAGRGCHKDGNPLRSPSPPPPRPPPLLPRSRSLRDLGRRVLGSVRPPHFKTHSLRKSGPELPAPGF